MSDGQRVAIGSGPGQLEGLTRVNRFPSEPRWRSGRLRTAAANCCRLSLHSVVYVPLEHFAPRPSAWERRRTYVRMSLRPCQRSVKSEVGRCWLQLPGIPVWTRKMLRRKKEREREKEWVCAFLWLLLLSQHRILETLRHRRGRVPAAKSVVPS